MLHTQQSVQFSIHFFLKLIQKAFDFKTLCTCNHFLLTHKVRSGGDILGKSCSQLYSDKTEEKPFSKKKNFTAQFWNNNIHTLNPCKLKYWSINNHWTNFEGFFLYNLCSFDFIAFLLGLKRFSFPISCVNNVFHITKQ